MAPSAVATITFGLAAWCVLANRGGGPAATQHATWWFGLALFEAAAFFQLVMWQAGIRASAPFLIVAVASLVAFAWACGGLIAYARLLNGKPIRWPPWLTSLTIGSALIATFLLGGPTSVERVGGTVSFALTDLTGLQQVVLGVLFVAPPLWAAGYAWRARDPAGTPRRTRIALGALAPVVWLGARILTINATYVWLQVSASALDLIAAGLVVVAYATTWPDHASSRHHAVQSRVRELV